MSNCNEIDKFERVRLVNFDRELSFDSVDDGYFENLNNKETEKTPIVYWLIREMRAENNWSLIFAANLAQRQKRPLCVIYNLIKNYDNPRKFWFEVDGLLELQKDLKEKSICLKVFLGEFLDKATQDNLDFYQKNNIDILVTDFYPLKEFNKQIESVAKFFAQKESLENREIYFFEVDSHNIVPARHLTDKQEYAARTIRPKIYKKIEEFLNPYPKIKKLGKKFKINKSENDFLREIKKNSAFKEAEKYDWLEAGHQAARKHLKNFLKNNFNNYFTDRNDPNLEGQSNFSPYLHFGMISAQEVALKVVNLVGQPISQLMSGTRNRAKNNEVKRVGLKDHAGAFLEELIIRKELTDNFCLHNRNYDNPGCFPTWAADSLYNHLKDQRKYLYSKKEFENAETYDDLWNSAQKEMINKGKMHGYMRMYWAKKILEWTSDPSEAMKIAIYLNDKYELDGSDPNGYAGIAWSIGGVHDRPWFNRPIFGKVRYMNRNGCENKFDVDLYIGNNLHKN